MGAELKYNVQKLDMETILSKRLEVQQFLDPVLNANLDYAARLFTNMPPAYRSGATLCVTGSHALVKFFQGNSDAYYDKCDQFDPDRSIHFTVSSKDGRPQLIRNVACGYFIRESDIQEVHFAGHNCQDQVRSCFNQAIDAVWKDQGYKDIHIICHGLSLTYTRDMMRNKHNTGQKVNDSICTVKTQCRLILKGCDRLKELLEMKCWLEQEKPQKKGLLACLDHLLKQVAEFPNPPSSGSTFILQGDGEMVELLESPGRRGTEFFIFAGPNGVSMSPAQWK